MIKWYQETENEIVRIPGVKGFLLKPKWINIFIYLWTDFFFNKNHLKSRQLISKELTRGNFDAAEASS